MKSLDIATELAPSYVSYIIILLAITLVALLVTGIIFWRMGNAAEKELALANSDKRRTFLLEVIPMCQGFTQKSRRWMTAMALLLAVTIAWSGAMYGTPFPGFS